MEQATFSELEHDLKKRRTAPRAVSGEDGPADSLGAAGAAHRAVLSEGGTGSAAVSAGNDASSSLRAVVLQRKRSGDGGPVV